MLSYLSTCLFLGHPCHHSTSLHQAGRGVSNRFTPSGEEVLCDIALRRRWYRFDGPAGGIMPETCVEEYSCGTHAPVWMNGKISTFQ